MKWYHCTPWPDRSGRRSPGRTGPPALRRRWACRDFQWKVFLPLMVFLAPSNRFNKTVFVNIEGHIYCVLFFNEQWSKIIDNSFVKRDTYRWSESNVAAITISNKDIKEIITFYSICMVVCWQRFKAVGKYSQWLKAGVSNVYKKNKRTYGDFLQKMSKIMLIK